MPSCRCANPPGGGVRCENSQAAVCRIVNGQCVTSCISTRGLRNSIEALIESGEIAPVIYWFLESQALALGSSLYLNDPTYFVESALAGSFIDEEGEVVNVSFPSELGTLLSIALRRY